MNTIALLALFAWTSSEQFVISPGSLEPMPGDAPAAAAFAEAHASLQSLGDAIHPYELPATMSLKAPSGGSRKWEVRFRGVGSTSYIDISVAAKSNSVTSIWTPDSRFANTPSEWRPEPPLLPTAAAAEAHLRELAEALGVPSHWDVARVQYQPETEDVRAAASISLHGGYRGRPIMGAFAIVRADPHNGRLMSAQLELEFAIETEEPILTAQQAKAIADQVYAVALAGRPAQPYNPEKPPILHYRWPTKFLGASVPVEAYPLDQDPRRYRIAWLVKYGDDHQIYVDAHTGQTLGGYIITRRPTE
jgi:hypothetical protein